MEKGEANVLFKTKGGSLIQESGEGELLKGRGARGAHGGNGYDRRKETVSRAGGTPE